MTRLWFLVIILALHEVKYATYRIPIRVEHIQSMNMISWGNIEQVCCSLVPQVNTFTIIHVAGSLFGTETSLPRVRSIQTGSAPTETVYFMRPTMASPIACPTSM